ncbi:GNAT family N-acetyltransferase [Deinococcus yavapaiensis]|uniref:Ribosomal protein S18 acetylase RimI-like enzyme n=1 Tax=Deinococcus yavapaiensis KR-236 TaxID=694435 RepID=A0A318SFF9_9DEIO|nr:GNAT family N-acetyltransferase [Deinococcus yavapaiensis]PYE55452.1 ribosomal protein S18 acetylase RimI-like enzyme [Deinococcus yavapaiensis KR-236]
MTTIVRHANEADVPHLLPLMRGLAAFEHYLDSFAVTEDVLVRRGFHSDPPDFHALVAEKAGEVVGTLVYYFVPFTATARPTLYIKELYVAEQARGEGVGEALMRAAAREAVRHACGAMRWAVAEWNAGGRRFYERLGAKANPVWIDYGLSGDALTTLAASSGEERA